MKQRIIFICGHTGSGKTVLGELLQDELSNSARVETDLLILVNPFEIGQKLLQLSTKNTISLISNFLEEGYENILVVGGVWNQKQLNQYIQKFPAAVYDVQVFWLHVSKEVRHARALKRGDPGDNKEWLEKIEESLPYPELPLSIPGGVFHEINAENKNPDKVLREISSFL